MSEADERHRSIVNHLTDGVAIVGADGLVRWSNASPHHDALRLHESIGHDVVATVHPEDRVRFAGTMAAARSDPGVAMHLESLRASPRSGADIWFDDTLTYLPDAPGINGVLLVRRRVSEARASEQVFRSMVESAQDAIYTADAEARYLYVNPAAARNLGTTPERLVGRKADEYFPLEFASQLRRDIDRVIRRGEDSIAGETQIPYRGRTLYFNTILQPVRDAQGKAVAAKMIARDITGIKEAEIALRLSEERLRQVIRLSHIGIFDHDHCSGEVYWSPEQREIYGWGAEERVKLAGETWELIHPDDRERLGRALREAHDSKGHLDEEHRIIRRDGRMAWVRVRSQTYFEGTGTERRAVRTIGATQDVTESKLSDRQLRLTQSAIEKSRTSIFWIDSGGRVVYANDNACSTLGLESGKLLGVHISQFDQNLTPESWTGVRDRLRENKWATVQTRYIRRDGSSFPVDTLESYLLIDGEEHVFVFAQDMTEREQAERELRLMHAAIDRAHTAFFAVDQHGTIIYANQHACSTLGYTRENLIGRPTWDVDPDLRAEDHPVFWHHVREVGSFRFNARHRRKDGTVFPVEVMANYFSFKGEEFGLVFALDITERIRGEQALRTSEERLRQATLVYNIGVFDHNHIANEMYWSPILRRQWGLGEDEVVSPSRFGEWIHPQDRQRIQAMIDRAHDPHGDGRYEAEHRTVHPDGTFHWVDTRAQTFFEGQGDARHPVRTVGAIVDVTQRVLAEEALRNSLREKETLLREVHHRVKNNLQIIASLLHFQAKKIRDPADLAAFYEGRDRLRSMILVHEKLYQSADLTRIDFANYLQSLARELQRAQAGRSGKRVEARIQVDEVALSIELAVPAGMIVCELLTNVYKYAYPEGQPGEVVVNMHTVDDDILLTVSDHGRGLPPDFDPRSSTSFGWQLIQNLTKQLGGTVEVSSSGAGTTVSITFPRESHAP